MCVETAPGGGEHHAVASQLEQVRIISLPLLLLLSAMGDGRQTTHIMERHGNQGVGKMRGCAKTVLKEKGDIL